MSSTLTIAVLAGLGGMFGWGSADFFAKKTTDVIGSIKTLIWAHLFGTTFFAAFIAVRTIRGGQGLTWPTSQNEWLALVFFGVLQMVVYWLVYEGFGKGKLAILNPVFASYSGIVAIVSLIFFGSVLTGSLALALVAIFGGLILLNLDVSGLKGIKLNVQPGLKEVLIAAIFAAIWTLGWDRFIGGKDPLSFSFFMYVFMSIAALGFARVKKEPIRGVDRSLWKFLIGIGFGEAVAYASISWGYSATSQVAVIALVSGSFSLPTIVLARLFLKEKVTQVQTIASVIIILGILLLVLKY